MKGDDCIRCGDMPSVDDLGYCGHCHWVAKAEFEEGFYAMREWLKRYDQFERWCVEHGWDAA